MSSIYQHFRPEEKEFIDQILNWRDFVENKYAPKLIDFLSPREQQVLKMIIGKGEILLSFSGGSTHTERKRAILYPEYFQIEEKDFNITLFEVEYPKKFFNLSHPQVLGSLMSLGMKREKFGDIVMVGDRVQFFCVQEMADYVQLELKTIAKANVQLLKLPLSEGLVHEELWREQTVTVSSLRLDTVISSVFQISRQKSQALVNGGLVKVNWTLIENTSYELAEGDTISVRGYGRSKVFSIEGKTKKEKWRINVGRQK